MEYNEKDLEEILNLVLESAPKHGLDNTRLELCYREALDELIKRKSNNIRTFYSGLQIDAKYINSFQMQTKRSGTHPLLKYYAEGWDNIRTKIKEIFKINLTDYDTGNVFVYLLRDSERKGILQGHGCCHTDRQKRPNPHYFFITGNYDELNKVIDSFKKDATNMSVFNEVIFDWKNDIFDVHNRALFKEPDLFSRMQTL